MRLENRVALVTGGGTGIGRATCLLFAREGASVAVAGRRPEPLQSVVAEIEAAGGRAIAVPGDVGKREDAESMVQATVDAFGRLDILVNNAGRGGSGSLLETSEEMWDSIHDTDLKSIFLVSRAALPHMIEQKDGRIVNVASQLALVGRRRLAAYSAAKGGVINLTRSMALDHAPDNIRVNVVCPGAVDTDLLWRPWKGAKGPSGSMDDLIRMHPLGRVGRPEEIATGILFLASDESSFMTGSTMVMDGGYTIH